MAGRLRGHIRGGVPRRAAGMPDPDHAAQPAVLRAGRPTGKLVNRFLLVSNIATQRSRRRSSPGNERVLRARLADAKFFFDQDRKQRLDARAAEARERRLSQQARHAGRSASSALRLLAQRIAPLLGADPGLARSRGGARQGRSRHRHGRRISGAAGPHGPLLRERTTASPPKSPRRSSSTTGRRRRAASCRESRGRAGRRARRQARSARGHLRHRPGADRRQGSVRTCAARRSACAHPDRAQALRVALSQLVAPRVRCVRQRARGREARRRARIHLERLRGYLRDQGYSANEIAAVLSTVPDAISTSAGAARGRAGVRGAARSRGAVRRQQAHREHPAQERRAKRAGGRPRAVRRRRRARFYLTFLRLTPQVDADFGRGRLYQRARGSRPAKPVGRPLFDDVMVMAEDPASAPTGWRCCAAGRTMNHVADISKLAT